MNSNNDFFAQGDLFGSLKGFNPDEFRQVQLQDNKLILLEGEAHNHAHLIEDPTAAMLYEDDKYNSSGNRRFLLSVVKPTRLLQVNLKTKMGYVSLEEYSKMQATNDPKLKLVEDLHAPIDLLPGQYEVITQRTVDLQGKAPKTDDDLEALIRPVID